MVLIKSDDEDAEKRRSDTIYGEQHFIPDIAGYQRNSGESRHPSVLQTTLHTQTQTKQRRVSAVRSAQTLETPNSLLIKPWHL